MSEPKFSVKKYPRPTVDTNMSTQTKTELSPQGQRAGALQLTFHELTKNEQLLVTFMSKDGRPVHTIVEIMEGLGWNKIRGGRARGSSRVRNTLRRLVRSQWLTHATEIGDGKYRLSKNGLDRLRRIVKEDDKPNAKPVPAPITDKQMAVEQEF
jgi:hypothetical protein